MATSTAEGTSYEGGAGGKLRRKPVRKAQSTPYDRPPLGRNPSWVSKMIVDPASKLVNAGAHLFFSSLFRKRLTLSPSSRGVDQESRGTGQETAILSPVEDQRPTPNDNGKQCIREDQGLEMKDSGKQLTTNGGFSELELMLKQKTFTRSEIDRLTEVLHSRTVESSDGERSTGFPIQETVFDSRGPDKFSRSYLQETRNESHLDNSRFAERVPTAVVSSEVFEEDVATPAEIAKAYMGNRSSKVSPSVLGLRTQATREDSVALCNSPFAPRSPVMSLIQKPSIYGGVRENGFMTPRSQGRSAIYSMARTPYSRNYPTVTQKGSSSIYNGYGGPSASPSTGLARELVSRSVSKDLALKRRSSVLEDEIGSVGPIRRLRQKTNLSTPKNTSLPIARTPFSSHGTGKPNICMDPSSSSKTFQGSDDNGNIPGKSYTPVPSQSKETARKILLQLEKLTPKEKQNKAGALGDNSPSKLMPNMTQGHSLRSLEDVDPSKLLQAAGYSLNSTQKGLLSDACETSSSRKQDKDEEKGQKSCNVSHESFTPAGTVSGTLKNKETVSPFSFSDSVKKQVTQPSQKKWGFQMTAQEDLLDVDDKTSSEAAPCAKLAEKKNILETTVLDSKTVPVTEKKTSASEFKAPAVSSELSRPTFLGTYDETKVVDGRSGFMRSVAPAAPASSTSLPPVVSVSQSTTFTNDVPDKEPNAPSPLLSSGTKLDDKISPFTSSFSPFVSGPFSLKPTFPTEVKQNTINSLAANDSDATETVPKRTESINSGAENTQKPEDTVGKPESFLSLPQSTSAPTNSLFTFSSKPSISSLSNGFLNSTTPSLFPSTAAISEATPSTSAISSSLLSPAFNFVSTSNSTPPSATLTTPSLPPTPDFKSGFSFMLPSIASTTSSATDLKANNEKEPNIANIPSSGNSVSTQVSAFATSATSSTFATSVSTPFTTGNSIYNSSISSGPTSGNTAFSSVAFQNNSSFLFNSSTASGSDFGLSTSAPSSTVFSFTAQTPAFGPSTGAMSSPSLFSFSSAAQTQPVFCSMPGGNNNNNNNHNNQVTMEDDSMAEDEVQVATTPILSPTPSFPAFNQPIVSNSLPNSTFMFASTLPPSSSVVNPFQFNGQQSQPIAQNPSPFQISGSGNFSLGSGGGEDKSGRRVIKVKRRNGKK